MSNEEKAKEISYNQAENFTLHGGTIERKFFESAMEMAEWKEQQMIEKACNWLIKGGYFVNNTENIEDFRKAMEE